MGAVTGAHHHGLGPHGLEKIAAGFSMTEFFCPAVEGRIVANRTDYFAQALPKLPRPSSEQERLTLKSAVRGAIERAGGGSALALRTDCNASALSKAGSANDDAHWLRIDVALDADREAGAPIIAATLAALQGFTLVRADDDRAPARASPAMTSPAMTLPVLAGLAKELGDVAPALITALADGRISAAERGRALTEIDEALTALHAARMALAHN